jgi:hypothetical protein
MADFWRSVTATPETIGIAVGAACVLAAVLIYVLQKRRRRPSPEEVERRRRVALYQSGKMGDGEIVDVEKESASIVYSYSVAGVVYTASQDLTALESTLPPDVMTMVGPVSVKFDPRNPANSIVICEEWSGLRSRSA